MVTIRTLEAGEKKYFYLEHTIREGKKFRNRRLYLGDTLPKDIEGIKERFLGEIFELSYGKRLVAIQKRFDTAFKDYPRSAQVRYLESFMIKFTFNSTKIEGGTLTLKETADLLQEQRTPSHKSMKDVQEAEAHKRVFYEMLDHKKRLSMATVLHWHRELFRGSDAEIAGMIRKHPVAIARSRTELPLPAELDTLLHVFFTWYKRAYGKINPVILAALVHLRFVSIHPFSDGNGRISRLLMNHTLHSNGYPMLNIEYSNRNAYYTALERSQTTHQEQIFVNYLVKRYLKEYRRP
jgi:Fic family protein